jgi:tripartite-type tricarboxylate transporter receptor subunit TctC
MWKRVLITALLAHASFATWAADGSPDSYPSKPIRIIDGFQAGGSTDYVARVVAAKMTERFGQTVIVENRPGASGNLAVETTARAIPDGYTLFVGLSAILSSSPSLYPKLGYDLLKDFSYVSRVAIGANVLLAHPSVPVKSLAELVALARSKPKAIRYGSGGVGVPSHLVMELLQRRTGMELLHIPYKGSAPAVIALTGGEVQVGLLSVAAAIPMIKAQRLTALAVASAKRVAPLPEVPTIGEAGVAGFDATNIVGLLAPAGTPAAVIRRLNAEIRTIVQMEDVITKFAAQGLEPAPSTPEEWRTIMEAEMAQWARVIKDANITAN